MPALLINQDPEETLSKLLEEYIETPRMKMRSDLKERLNSMTLGNRNWKLGEHSWLVQLQTRSGLTALHCAVSRRQKDAVKRIVRCMSPLDRYALLASKNNGGRTPLHYAATNGCSVSIRIMLDSLLTVKQQKDVLAIKDVNGQTALDIATFYNNPNAASTINGYRLRQEPKGEVGNVILMYIFLTAQAESIKVTQATRVVKPGIEHNYFSPLYFTNMLNADYCEMTNLTKEKRLKLCTLR